MIFCKFVASSHHHFHQERAVGEMMVLSVVASLTSLKAVVLHALLLIKVLHFLSWFDDRDRCSHVEAHTGGENKDFKGFYLEEVNMLTSVCCQMKAKESSSHRCFDFPIGI